MPGYKKARNEVREAGIDDVYVYCVNDAAVMEAWAKDQKIAGTNITFVADTTSALTKALGMELTAAGPMRDLGNPRCKRFGLYVDNGVGRMAASIDSRAFEGFNFASYPFPMPGNPEAVKAE